MESDSISSGKYSNNYINATPPSNKGKRNGSVFMSAYSLSGSKSPTLTGESSNRLLHVLYGNQSPSSSIRPTTATKNQKKLDPVTPTINISNEINKVKKIDEEHYEVVNNAILEELAVINEENDNKVILVSNVNDDVAVEHIKPIAENNQNFDTNAKDSIAEEQIQDQTIENGIKCDIIDTTVDRNEINNSEVINDSQSLTSVTETIEEVKEMNLTNAAELNEEEKMNETEKINIMEIEEKEELKLGVLESSSTQSKENINEIEYIEIPQTIDSKKEETTTKNETDLKENKKINTPLDTNDFIDVIWETIFGIR